MSHYRAAGHFEATTDSPDTLPRNDTPPRRVVLTVLVITVAMGLVYLGVIGVLESGSNDRVPLLGAFLITTAGAVVLNAITLEATNRPVRNSGR